MGSNPSTPHSNSFHCGVGARSKCGHALQAKSTVLTLSNLAYKCIYFCVTFTHILNKNRQKANARITHISMQKWKKIIVSLKHMHISHTKLNVHDLLVLVTTIQHLNYSEQDKTKKKFMILIHM